MPLPHYIPFSDGTLLYLWNVTETEHELKSQCHTLGIDTAPVQHYRSARRRTEVMVEWLMVRHVLGDGASIVHDSNGAPFVNTSHGKAPHVSISHTKGLVCLAVNASHPIGIDAERIGDRVLRVRSRFLNDEEMTFIDPENITANLIAWTAKEALYKVGGNTRTIFAGDIRLQRFDAAQDAPITFRATCHDAVHHVTALLLPDYVFSIAVEEKHGSPLPETSITSIIL